MAMVASSALVLSPPTGSGTCSHQRPAKASRTRGQGSCGSGGLETRRPPPIHAGIRIEPPASLPCAIRTAPAATAAAEPPLDPPADRSRNRLRPPHGPMIRVSLFSTMERVNPAPRGTGKTAFRFWKESIRSSGSASAQSWTDGSLSTRPMRRPICEHAFVTSTPRSTSRRGGSYTSLSGPILDDVEV
jgi:hypothetical protein